MPGGGSAIEEIAGLVRVSRLRRFRPSRRVHPAFHPLLRGDGDEAERCVDAVGIASGQVPAADGLQVGVLHQEADHVGADPLAAGGFGDDDVTEVCEGGAVGDDAGEGELVMRGGVEGADDDAVVDRSLNDVAADVG